MFIIILRYTQPLSRIDAFIPEHKEFLQRHYDAGHFLLSGRREPRNGGVILAKAESKDVVMEIVHDDPFYREQLASYEVIEFIPSMSAPELAGLLQNA